MGIPKGRLSTLPHERDRVLYTATATATATATGGRAGRAYSDDGMIDFDLRPPTELGGPGEAKNPEQLSAAGYAACFQGARGVAGRRQNIDTPGSLVGCSLSIGPVGDRFGLAVRLEVETPGVEADVCQNLAEDSYRVCPYPNATRGNLAVDVVAWSAAEG